VDFVMSGTPKGTAKPDSEWANKSWEDDPLLKDRGLVAAVARSEATKEIQRNLEREKSRVITKKNPDGHYEPWQRGLLQAAARVMAGVGKDELQRDIRRAARKHRGKLALSAKRARGKGKQALTARPEKSGPPIDSSNFLIHCGVSTHRNFGTTYQDIARFLVKTSRPTSSRQTFDANYLATPNGLPIKSCGFLDECAVLHLDTP
jgi:hypothetical protein